MHEIQIHVFIQFKSKNKYFKNTKIKRVEHEKLTSTLLIRYFKKIHVKEVMFLMIIGKCQVLVNFFFQVKESSKLESQKKKKERFL